MKDLGTQSRSRNWKHQEDIISLRVQAAYQLLRLIYSTAVFVQILILSHPLGRSQQRKEAVKHSILVIGFVVQPKLQDSQFPHSDFTNYIREDFPNSVYVRNVPSAMLDILGASVKPLS